MANHRNTFGYDLIRGSTQSTFPTGHSSNRNVGNSSLANSTNCANLRHGHKSSSDGYIAGRLPLPDNFFPVPQLSTTEKNYLLGLAKHACKEVVYCSRQKDGPMNWIQLSSDDGVDVFQGVNNCGTSNTQDTKALTYLRGACKIHATIDEISDFFKLDTPAKLSGYAQTVGKDLLDQKTLLTLATPTPENPKHFVAIKWSAVESPSKVTRNRDFCYIECHDEFVDSNTKRRGWVKSIHSIRLPFCPPLHRSHGLVRGSFYRSGYVFTESEEKGCVDAVHTLHMDIKGNAPDWLTILVTKRRIKSIAEVDRHFQLQRLAQGKLLGDLELPDKEKVTWCQLCKTRFGFFHRRRICRKCGKVVCTPCGNAFWLDYAGFGPKKVEVCLKCLESVVYDTSAPMMDGAGHILSDNHAYMKLESREICPAYDDFPPGSMTMLENRHHSAEENEYYLYDDDGNGSADMEEAKRMNKEFEETLKETSDEVSEPVAHPGGFRTSPESLRSVISLPRETMAVKKSPGANNESPPSEQGGFRMTMMNWACHPATVSRCYMKNIMKSKCASQQSTTSYSLQDRELMKSREMSRKNPFDLAQSWVRNITASMLLVMQDLLQQPASSPMSLAARLGVEWQGQIWRDLDPDPKTVAGTDMAMVAAPATMVTLHLVTGIKATTKNTTM
ncbi:unnamed protein product [Peronospora destructor]|uniref:FYVE-type domain-containing protein n=1 Tax=Peronospora destructor TaxID=86335 RepID=A0AAV0SVF8_9STRA|nr:unnamed protein product [Peronospora destructor]